MVFALAVTAFGVANPGEHVFTGRDDGTYLATAGWLAHSGSLRVDARVGAFEEADDWVLTVPGFYDLRPDGILSPQFLHAFPSMLATLGQVGGLRAMLLLNPLLGGLALLCCFFVAARLGSGYPALVSVGLLGASQIFTYFSRAPYSEPLALLFFLAGCMAVLTQEESGRRSMGLGGALLGGVALARLDGLILTIGVAALLVVSRRAAPSWAKPVRALATGFIVVLAIAIMDLAIDPFYARGRSSQILAIGLVAIAILISGVVTPEKVVERLKVHFLTYRARYGWVLAATGGLLVLVAWFVRPRYFPAKGDTYSLEVLQQAAGVPIDATRTYAELSIHWLTMYLGAGAVAVAFVGLALLVVHQVQTPDLRIWTVLLLILLVSTVYLWRPSINPDHIWASRRFLPIILPGLAFGVGYCVHLAVRSNRSLVQWLGVGIAVLSLAVVLGRVPVTIGLHEFEGAVADFQELCDAVQSDAVVVVDPRPQGVVPRLVQSVRSYCGVPAAGVQSMDGLAEQVSTVAAGWASEDRRTFVLAPSPTTLESVPTEPLKEFFGAYDILEYTLFEAPTATQTVDFGLVGARVALD